MVKKKRHDQEDETDKGNIEVTDNQNDYETVESGAENSPGDEKGDSEEGGRNTPDNIVVNDINFEVKLAEMQDKYIRLSAEFDNYRKRTLREKMELAKYASENVLGRVIPFMDDFERALKHMGDCTDCDSIKSGIELIYEKFSSFLKQNGVTEIEAHGLPFNVDVHEAVAKVPVQEEEKKGKVVDVVSKGYFLQDKILRFSKVVVGE